MKRVLYGSIAVLVVLIGLGFAYKNAADVTVRYYGELAVKGLLERMSNALQAGERIEVRGFGSFCLHHRPARLGRNPKTGMSVQVPDRRVPHFKPGKELRERVDQ